MPHDYGVKRPEPTRRGYFAAQRLIENGKTEWSIEDLSEHLLGVESHKTASWYRGFLACFVIQDIISLVDAEGVIEDLNPGHWTSLGLPESYLEFGILLSDEISQAIDDGLVQPPHPAGDDLEIDHCADTEGVKELNNFEVSSHEILERLLTKMFFQLNVDRARMLEDYVASLTESHDRQITGDWSEALIRSSQLLYKLGWRVRFADRNDATIETHGSVDFEERLIVLRHPQPESLQVLLYVLGRLSLREMDGVALETELHRDLAAEMVGCLVGWTFGVQLVDASLASVRSQLLSSDLKPSDVYSESWKATLAAASWLFDQFEIDVLELED